MSVVNEDVLVIHTSGSVSVEIPVFTSGATQSVGCEFETKFFDIADYAEELSGETLKILDAVILDVQTDNQPQFLKVSIGCKENINDQPTWTAFEAVDPGKPNYLRLPKCRYVAVRCRDVGPNVDYEISKITLFGTVVKGARRG